MMVQHTEHICLIAMTESIFKNELLNSLRQENCRFLFAGTGEEAIGIWRQYPDVKLILIDINLPVINGIETIKVIRHVDADIPVILLVTHIMLETMRLAQNLGCNEILQTPVEPTTLETIIYKYLPSKST